MLLFSWQVVSRLGPELKMFCWGRIKEPKYHMYHAMVVSIHKRNIVKSLLTPCVIGSTCSICTHGDLSKHCGTLKPIHPEEGTKHSDECDTPLNSASHCSQWGHFLWPLVTQFLVKNPLISHSSWDSI